MSHRKKALDGLKAADGALVKVVEALVKAGVPPKHIRKVSNCRWQLMEYRTNLQRSEGLTGAGKVTRSR